MVRLSRISKILFKNIIPIVIRVAYKTKVFENAGNIEIVYQVAYQKIIQEGNYLKLSKKETIIQLLSYIKNISYLRSTSKDKRKDIGNIILLVLSTRTIGSASSILLTYI